ncbi:MAG: hypothetical protein WCF57_02065 [Pyrinomonadaceae bacterium]
MPDRHDNKEVPIFRIFAEVCGLPIEHASIEKREPPEPDILCNMVGESAVAFEMVELVDQKKIARPMGDQTDLMVYFRDSYENLPDGLKVEFDKRFRNAHVLSKLRSDYTMRKRKKLVHDILDQMMRIDPDFEGTFSMREGEIEVASVRIKRGNFAGPHFRVLAAASYNPIPLAQLQAKFEKKYSSHAPIELLAYYDRQHAPLKEQLIELISFVEAHISGSCFRRVWIFNVNDRRICFSVTEGG